MQKIAVQTCRDGSRASSEVKRSRTIRYFITERNERYEVFAEETLGEHFSDGNVRSE